MAVRHVLYQWDQRQSPSRARRGEHGRAFSQPKDQRNHVPSDGDAGLRHFPRSRRHPSTPSPATRASKAHARRVSRATPHPTRRHGLPASRPPAAGRRRPNPRLDGGGPSRACRHLACMPRNGGSAFGRDGPGPLVQVALERLLRWRAVVADAPSAPVVALAFQQVARTALSHQRRSTGPAGRRARGR